MSAATLGGLIGTLVAARHAGGYRYDFPERVLRQFAGHCRREGYADGSIVREAVEEFLYGRHLKASTIRREELVLRDLAGHARQFGWQAWAPPALTAVKKPHRPPPYVFSDEEIRRLFRVIDTQPLSENSNRALVDPVLFRVFYGTGMLLPGSPAVAQVWSSCLRSSEADGMTLACAAGVAQAPDAACHRWRGRRSLSWAMSPVGGPGRGEVLVVFFELEAQVDGLLFEMGDLLAEGVDVGGGAEPGLAPGLVAERLGQAFLQLAHAGGQPDASVHGRRAGRLAARRR